MARSVVLINFYFNSPQRIGAADGRGGTKYKGGPLLYDVLFDFFKSVFNIHRAFGCSLWHSRPRNFTSQSNCNKTLFLFEKPKSSA